MTETRGESGGIKSQKPGDIKYWKPSDIKSLKRKETWWYLKLEN